ncbi:MAG: hypothetical protein JO250_20630 [Armatimonadetes bacterium]|nr:hypothetical protein [Armatimonadota bacterium]
MLTDVATGWTECRPLLHRSEAGVTDAITQVRQSLPFCVRGLDTDNGSEFINYEMLRYAEIDAHHARQASAPGCSCLASEL